MKLDTDSASTKEAGWPMMVLQHKVMKKMGALQLKLCGVCVRVGYCQCKHHEKSLSDMSNNDNESRCKSTGDACFREATMTPDLN